MTELADWSTLTTAERDAIITPLWADGLSAGAIAETAFVGATRNMVIGRVHRAKLPKRNERANVPPRSKKRKLPMAVVSHSAFVAVAEPDEPTQSVMDMIARNRPPLPWTKPVGILAMPNRPGVLCRFPVDGDGGKMMYCGVPSGDHTYCTDHKKLAYRGKPKEIVIGKNQGHNRPEIRETGGKVTASR